MRERAYTDADLPLIQSALAGWVRAAGPCGYCHVGELAHRISGHPLSLGRLGEVARLWEAGGRVLAIAILLRFGAGFDLFVAPELRGGPAERQLLAAAAAATTALMAELPGSDGVVISDVYGCDEARQALLAELGFARYRQWDELRVRDLGRLIPAAPPPAGFSVRPATLADAEQLAEARNQSFGGEWSGPRYRAQVMERPGYDPAREIVAVAPDGRVAAFTVIWADELNRAGLFEPVGTHGAFRRLGLARSVICAGLRELRRLGMATAQVSHDAANLPARALYEGLGFHKRDETLGYRRAPHR